MGNLRIYGNSEKILTSSLELDTVTFYAEKNKRLKINAQHKKQTATQKHTGTKTKRKTA